MAKYVIKYNLMVAHSGDTAGFVDVVKEAVDLFCKEYSKYNDNDIIFDVKDYNDATFSSYSEEETQSIVFEQFAGHADIVVALIGKRIGDGLRKELHAAKEEHKQTFVYLHNAGIPYDVFSPNKGQLEKEIQNALDIAKEFYNIGYAKSFVGNSQLIEHVMNDLGRFLQFRLYSTYELKDQSYRDYSLLDVDRYRKEIGITVSQTKKQQCSGDADPNKQLEAVISRIEDHSKANIIDLMRLFRKMISDRYGLEYTDITVSFVWGYHDPINNEKIIIPSEVIVLNHAGAPAKLIDLLRVPHSLLRFMLVTGANYEWYQHKSVAFKQDRYFWSVNEYLEKNKAKESEEEWGGSIFCYRVVLNGDGSSTNNYLVGFIMVSTYEKPIINTVHDSIRKQVKQTIRNMIDFRIKPQLLTELSQLYLVYLQRFSNNLRLSAQEEPCDVVTEEWLRLKTEIEQEFEKNTSEINS